MSSLPTVSSMLDPNLSGTYAYPSSVNAYTYAIQCAMLKHPDTFARIAQLAKHVQEVRDQHHALDTELLALKRKDPFSLTLDEQLRGQALTRLLTSLNAQMKADPLLQEFEAFFVPA